MQGLRIAHTNSIFERDYFLEGVRLDRVVVEKDLGILLRQDLSWNHHVDLITSKAQKMLNLLYRTCKDVNDVEIKKCSILTCMG